MGSCGDESLFEQKEYQDYFDRLRGIKWVSITYY